MKIKKILAAIAASAVAVSTMAVNVFAADEYTAKLGFSDMSWTYQDWESSTTVTGDGQYTIESTTVAGSPDFGVFVIDIEGMYADHPEASAVLDKIEIDGAEVSFDAAKIVYGDIEEKGNYRIEIYNQYGTTKDDTGVEQATPIKESLKLTFTVSGMSGAAAPADDAAADDTASTDTADTGAAETTAPASDGDTASTTTGNVPAAVMVSVMAVAGTAAVISRKRK